MILDPEKQAFVDRFLIREQLENYIDALNHRDWDRLAATLCDEFRWNATEPFNLSYAPKSSFVEMLRTVQSYQFGFVFQMGHGIVIRELDGKRAKTCQTLVIYGNSFECIGLYYDELRKEDDGVWRFVTRDYRPTYHDQRNAPGSIYRQLPDPNHANLPEA